MNENLEFVNELMRLVPDGRETDSQHQVGGVGESIHASVVLREHGHKTATTDRTRSEHEDPSTRRNLCLDR